VSVCVVSSVCVGVCVCVCAAESGQKEETGECVCVSVCE